jgi:signal transduction histidine kinase
VIAMRQSAYQSAWSYALAAAVLVAAILGVAFFGRAVLGMPGTDVRDLIVFLAASGVGSILVGYALISAPPRLGLGGVRSRLMLAHLAVLAIAFANIVVTAWLMFISPHDLGLLGLLLAFSAIVAFAFAALTAEQVLRAVRELAAAAREMAGGKLGVRVATEGPDELVGLARDFNAMSERLEASDRMRREMETARRHLFAAISHDLRTPLASIRAMVEAIDDGVVTDAETTQRYVRNVLGEVHRLSGLIDDLFELSRLEAGDLQWSIERIEVAELVEDAVAAMQLEAEANGVAVGAERVDPGLAARADAQKLRRVLFNLIQNAIRHTPADGSVTVRAEPAGEWVEIEVADTGRGIPADERERVFDPFVRGERARSGAGAGLGLAISRAIVEAHNGRIWVADSEVGTRVRFVIPA